MSDRFFALRLFVRVAHTGSFSRAGREFGLSQPSASRIIAELEREVGATFFIRTTRAVTLTDVGADYLARVEPTLTALEEADTLARGTGELRGTLRVAMSSSFGVREVIPRLSTFLETHPHLRMDVIVDDRHQDLVGDGIDVALRFGTLADSTAIARKLGTPQRILIASPEYLRRAGTPQTVADLASHILIAGPGSRPVTWSFAHRGTTSSLRVNGRFSVSSHEAIVSAALAGLGIAMTGLWGCRTELASGALVQVLREWDLGTVEVHAVFPAGRATKPAARAFAEYLESALAQR